MIMENNETTTQTPATEVANSSGQTPTEDKPDVGNTSKIDEANAAAKRIEDATAAQKLENDRTEKLRIAETFGGTANAGEIVEKKEETPQEYAARMERGE